MSRLSEIRIQKGTLEPDQDALWGRCDRFVKRLKGLAPRRRRETEGVDETNTYSVLSSEGFLPGYGLEVGAVTGFFLVPRNQVGLSDFDLPRVSSVAVREYVPGNLIYANGNRFLPRYYHLDPQGVQDQVRLQVDIENQAVAEFGGKAEAAGPGLGAQAIRAVPICDVDLPHQSHITDEEDYRFQLAVSVFGKEQDRHGEGKAFHWGSKQVSLRRSVHLRLVNVGPTSKVQRGELGYPVCLVCGQSRSPLASQADQDNFRQEHAERCHQNVEPTGSPGNEKEQMLRDMLLRAGFVAPVMNREIDLGRPHPKTYPDVFFEVPDGRKEGVCLYLDGMSGRLHGNPQTAQQDRLIRELLRNENYEVIEIPVGNLDDREAMRRHFHRIGAVLLGKERAVRTRDNPDWHSGSLRRPVPAGPRPQGC